MPLSARRHSNAAKPRSGLSPAEQREFPRHRKWIRAFICVVCASEGQTGYCGMVEGAHVRIGTDGGTGLKPHDAFLLPLCTAHHSEQHRIGEESFEARYPKAFPKGMKAKALEFARQSPVPEVRERAMKERA